MKESNLSFKNIFKRETKLASYVIICTTIVVISVSYAMFFQVNENSKNQEVTAGDLKFTYTKGEEISSNGKEICFTPMSYEESTLYIGECGYQFSVRNTGSLKGNYTFKLKANIDHTMESSKLKVVLRKQIGEKLEVIESYPKKISELTEEILTTEEIEANKNIVYSVQIYVDENEFIDGDETKKVSYQIEGSGLVHEDNPIEIDESIATNYIKKIAKTSEELVLDETADNNLRYIGSNPNNYVFFNNELWRIIGVMNNMKTNESDLGESRIKLVRKESIGQLSWDTSVSSINSGFGINDWTNADLMKLMNEGYENESIGGSLYWNAQSGKCYNGRYNATTTCNFTSTGLKDETSKNMIANTLWNIGGSTNYSTAEDGLTKHWYLYERGNNVIEGRPVIWQGKVGLIYPSDYGYSSAGGDTKNRESCLLKEIVNWKNIEFADCKNNSWLYNTFYKWTITPHIEDPNHIFFVSSDGNVGDGDAYNVTNLLRVLPSVYLKPEVKIISGTGESSNPYLLSL